MTTTNLSEAEFGKRAVAGTLTTADALSHYGIPEDKARAERKLRALIASEPGHLTKQSPKLMGEHRAIVALLTRCLAEITESK